MSAEMLILTRDELYEKVWFTPMQKLAGAFDLSDVGLTTKSFTAILSAAIR